MQLSAISKVDGKPSMVVDFYPVQLSDGNIATGHMLKVLKFQGVDAMSTKCITKRDFDRECNDRINMGWEVTGFNTTAQYHNPIWGAC